MLTRPKPWPSSSENMRVTSEASAKSFLSGRLTMPRIGSFSRRAESRTMQGSKQGSAATLGWVSSGKELTNDADDGVLEVADELLGSSL
jgi:hypothetical protein